MSKVNTLLELLAGVPRQRKFLKRLVADILQRHSVSIGSEFTLTDLKKIEQYYGLFVPLVIGNMMSRLHGRALTVKERETFTLMGAISGLYDDFFDKHQLPSDAIKELTTTYRIDQLAKANIRAYQAFLIELVNRIEDVEAFSNTFLDVFDAQVASLQQTTPLATAALLTLSREKGGSSVLFYRTALTTRPIEAEQAFWFQTGALGQLCNDIFDLYKDQQEGIYTFASSCGSTSALLDQFNRDRQLWRDCLERVPVPAHHRHQCAHFFELVLLSRTRVCLHHLAEVEKRYGSYQPRSWTRKDLVTDMETIANISRQLRYYFAQ